MPEKSKPPYNPAACCGEDCDLFDEQNPDCCWGDVELTGGDEAIYDDDGNVTDVTSWEHRCQAHMPDRKK